MNLEEFKSNGDWRCCFNEAFGIGFSWNDEQSPVDTVKRVIHSVEGENDGDCWLALVEFNEGTQKMPFAKVYAGCDYTGWDFQAGGNVKFYATEAELTLPTTLTKDERERLGLK